MLIDWFTVCAQILNFLILVWLLKRFLYKPVLDAIDSRERRIANELANADAKQVEAQQERDLFQHKNQEIDQQRTTLLALATKEADVERQKLLETARTNMAAFSVKRELALKDEETQLRQKMRSRTLHEVFAVARKALTDLAGVSLEERMVEIFVRRLSGLNADDKRRLGAELKTSSSPAVVRAAFDLPLAQCALTEAAIQETLGMQIQFRFETAPELISGIELVTNGHKLSWNIADYLTSLERGVEQTP